MDRPGKVSVFEFGQRVNELSKGFTVLPYDHIWRIFFLISFTSSDHSECTLAILSFLIPLSVLHLN
uniref:Uncharacterized protein n=1 Tax=Pristionchus pacificus TaxID=54126 RepID=A0A2A6D0G7_PRIPA|eukprot:PDM83972.1 hypothetical protein PRIPAC_34164 [Pristionchus pacificus]